MHVLVCLRVSINVVKIYFNCPFSNTKHTLTKPGRARTPRLLSLIDKNYGAVSKINGLLTRKASAAAALKEKGGGQNFCLS